MTAEIYILNGTSHGDKDLGRIAPAVSRIFGAAVTIRRARLDMTAAFDPARGQSNSTALLAQLLRDAPAPDVKRIAVVDVDLFIPVLTFVFGEAQLNGNAAVVSTHRLANQFYGLPKDNRRMLERLEKEIVHELGHTFGLYHCRQFECVMRSSTYVEEIDLKSVTPCAACAAALQSG